MDMRANTLITLGASVACAALAVFLAKGWIDDAVAEHRGAPMSVEGKTIYRSAPMQSVLVAETSLDFGDELGRDVLSLVDYPEGSVPQGAYTSYEELGLNNGRIVALTKIVPGEPVLNFKISVPGSRAKLAQVITPGLRATTIRVNSTEQVAGFVLPGDRVDVLFIRDEEKDTTYGLDMRSDVMLQNVRVLGIDQAMSEYRDGSLPGSTATLELSLDDVQRVTLASQVGSLTLVLRSIAEQEIVSARSLKRTQILAAPKAPARRAPRPKAPTPSKTDETSKVVVMRGDARDEVSVIRERDDAPEFIASNALAGG